jgi:hypothetical protein
MIEFFLKIKIIHTTMPTSRIEVLDRVLQTQKKDLLFIINKVPSMPIKTREILESLTRGKPTEILEFDFDGILYGALRGWLNEQHIDPIKHGEVSIDYAMRIEDLDDQRKVNYFTGTIKKYNHIKSVVHSKKDDEEIDAFAGRLSYLYKKFSTNCSH